MLIIILTPAIKNQIVASSTRTTISVEGYDTRLHEYPLKLVLEKHFASCGKMGYIYVPKDFKRGTLKRYCVASPGSHVESAGS